MIRFRDCLKAGKVGEIIFKDDFLDFLGICYENVTGKQQYQVIDSDYITKIGLYEIKTNYKDDKKIIVEEYTNINEALSPISHGWFYKCKADLLVCVSKRTRTMVLIPFHQKFKDRYEKIKSKSPLIFNAISSHNGRKWQSAFRRINLDDIAGYYSMYRRVPPLAEKGPEHE